MASDVRAYIPREKRMLVEWLARTHPKVMQWRNVRLGPIPHGNPAFNTVRRYADAVLLDNNVVYIVEASVMPDYTKIAQLELYESMFPETPEFSSVAHLPIKKVFLTSMLDKYTKDLAESKGVDYEVFTPAWIKDYLKEKLSG